MPEFRKSSIMPVAPAVAFEWHGRPGAFDRLMPPWMTLGVLERSGGIRNGGRVLLEVSTGLSRIRWEARHVDYLEGRQFVDEQVAGPFRRWKHVHRFLSHGADECVLEDTIEYEPPLGVVGNLVAGRAITRRLERVFEFRHRRTAADLARHLCYPNSQPLRIVMSGASGLVGSHLAPYLTAGGHRVDALTRRSKLAGSTDIEWNPAAGQVDPAALEGCDAVVHLAGENVAGRWTAAKKSAIRASRVDSTGLLARTIARMKRPPATWICASAIGYYGDRGDEELTEASLPGEGFLADVSREWESATALAQAAGVRIVHLRIGIVLSPKGGALGKLLRPFSMGVGGVVGSGRQFMSWIALDDLVGLIHHALRTPTLVGPVNAVAPAPVTNREFTQTLGRVLNRPTMLPLPAPMVRAFFGDMGEALLLGSARVLPRAALVSGFKFQHAALEDAFRAELGIYPRI